MRPRRLRVKGYTAFLEEAEVDFDGLDLFAITGPTGAGKTSLLQAMTIALYGRAPKLGDDLRQLISPLAEQARFYFEFQAHGRSYRITRVMFRNRPTAVAFEAQGDDGIWQTLTRGVREANARVEQILGLDFDSFTKVVLLPQNEFDAFLRGKPEERRSILTRLLSLEIYGRIQQRANQVAAEARTQAELLTGLLERDYADATPAHLAAVKEARVSAETAVATGTERLGACEHAVGVAFEARQRRRAHDTAREDRAASERALGTARDEHKVAADALEVAEHEVHDIAERLASITYNADRHLVLAGAAERATRLGEVVAALAGLDDDDAAGRARLAELARRRAELVTAVADAQRARVSSEEVEGESDRNLREQERRYGTRTAIAGLIERERRYRIDRDQEESVERSLRAATMREAELTAAHAGLRASHAAATARSAEAQAIRQKRELAYEAARAMRSQALSLAESLDAASDRVATAEKAVQRAQVETERRRELLAGAERGRGDAVAAVRGAEEHLGQLERAHAAHTLRAALAVGQPCPVCEATVGKVPPVEVVDDLENARRVLDGARSLLVKAQRSEQRATGDMAFAGEALRAAGTTLEDAVADRARLAADLRAGLPAELREDAQWTHALQARVDAVADERSAAELAVEEARHLVTGIETDIAGIDGELRTLPSQISERSRAMEAIRERCDETERALQAVLGDEPGPGAGTELVTIGANLRGMEEALAAAKGAVQRERERLHQATAAAASMERDVEAEEERAQGRGDERARLTREREEIQRALQEIVPGQPDATEAITAELGALTDARARRDAVQEELRDCQRAHDDTARRVTGLAARLGALQRQLDEQRHREERASAAMDLADADLTATLTEAGIALETGAGDEYEQLTVVVQDARQERDTAVRRSGELAFEEQALAERIERAAVCRAQRDDTRTRMEVARELGQLLGAHNLQTYLLGDAMRVLGEDGSLHLQRLSDGRYRLKAEDLDFLVVDGWNGDALRSVKTLSGGETFLTSLALALALAERLADLAAGAHGHETLESLFIDEGFGALDTQETLETVVQAIEALQAHDRLVGIVTHLTPLAERMPARINVLKAPEGSRVEMVR